MNKIAVFFCVSLLLLTGCLPLVRRPYVMRIVELSFPVSAGQSKASLSANDPEVQEALRIIDAALISDGFVRDLNRPGANEPGLIASYAKFDDAGLRHVGTPDVYLRSDRLEVAILELGNRSGRPTAATRRVCDLLRKELGGRYGTERVRVLKADR